MNPRPPLTGVPACGTGHTCPGELRRPTILIIDDDEVFVELLSDELRPHFFVEWARDGQTALAAVARGTPDAIFLNHGLPDIAGVALIDELRKGGCAVPVVMLTASQDVRAAAQAMRAGAIDFVVKDIKDGFYDSIVPTATRAVEKWNNEKELEYLREQEAEQARHAQQLNHELRDKNNQLQQACAQIEASHRQLGEKNKRLSDLYETAHRFVDNVSHEMRTPLTVIKEFLSIVLDGLAGEINPQQTEYLNIAMAKTNDLARMVDDMLDISKIEAGLLRVDRSCCRLDDIMQTVVGQLQQKARSSQLVLKEEIASNLEPVFCDCEKMARVLINLVVNAMKFSQEGARITLWARRGEQPDEILAGVTDQGPGISARDVKIIFERFRQVGGGENSSTKGFGLGLNIVRELVNLNLGDVHVDSVEGKGSTFWFSVPVFDYEQIMRRYLSRRSTYDHHGDQVVLIRAYPQRSDPELSTHVKDFVSHYLSPFDVCFERQQQGDVIIAAITDNPRTIAQRLTVKNREEQRLSPGSTVDIDFEIVRTLALSDDNEKIVHEFAALFEVDSVETT